MTIRDIKERFETEALSEFNCGIKAFRFGFLSELVNANKKEDYPMVLLQPFDSNILNIEETTEQLTIDLYIFDVDHCKDGKDACRLWEELHHMGTTLLRRICSDDDYAIIGNVTVSRDASMHNDKLIGVRYQFTMHISNECGIGCICVEDGQGNEVCELATGDQIQVEIDEIPEEVDPNLFTYTVRTLVPNTFAYYEATGSDGTMNWGDGTPDEVVDGSTIETEHEYLVAGDYTVTVVHDDINLVTGALTGSSFSPSGSITGTLDLTPFVNLQQFIHQQSELVDELIFPPNTFTDIQFSFTNRGSDIIMDLSNISTSTNNLLYDFRNNGWSESFINQILIDLDSVSVGGFTTREIKLQNNTAPIGAGITANNSLISKGFTVTTD